MFDKEIALDNLRKIRSVIDTISDRTSMMEDLNDFLCTPGGMLWLDAVV